MHGGAEEFLGNADQQPGQGEAGDQPHPSVTAAPPKRAKDEQLGHNAEQPAADQCDDKGHGQGQTQSSGLQPDVSTDHQEGALRKVHDVQHTEDQRASDREHCVDRSER